MEFEGATYTKACPSLLKLECLVGFSSLCFSTDLSCFLMSVYLQRRQQEEEAAEPVGGRELHKRFPCLDNLGNRFHSKFCQAYNIQENKKNIFWMKIARIVLLVKK